VFPLRRESLAGDSRRICVVSLLEAGLTSGDPRTSPLPLLEQGESIVSDSQRTCELVPGKSSPSSSAWVSHGVSGEAASLDSRLVLSSISSVGYLRSPPSWPLSWER